MALSDKQAKVELSPGDCVKFCHNLYTHWGVYSKPKKVVNVTSESISYDKMCTCQQPHWAELDFASIPEVCSTCGSPTFGLAVVKEEDISYEAGNNAYEKDNSLDSRWSHLSPDDVVDRAYREVGKVAYNLLYLNCEHFVTWCRYNHPYTTQGIKYEWKDPAAYLKALKNIKRCVNLDGATEMAA